MKRTKLLSFLPIFLALAIFITSCSKKEEYTKVIPANAAMVVSVDFKSIVEKSGITNSNNKVAFEKVLDIFKNNKLKKLIQNPSETGLSLSDQVYLFGSVPDFHPAVVLSVSDEGKLEDAFSEIQKAGFCDELKNDNGYSWTILEGQAVCVFDDSSLLIVTAGANLDINSAKEMAFTLIKQEVDKSITSNKAFQKMIKEKSDVALYVSLASMPQESSTAMMIGLPGGVDLTDMRLLAHANFEKGKVSINSEYFTENNELKEYLKKQSEACGKRTNKFLKNIPATVFAYMGTNFTGTKLYDFLLENKEFKASAEELKLTSNIDLKKLFTSFNGDASIALSDLDEEGIPSFIIYSQVDNNYPLKSVFALKSYLGFDDEIKIVSNGKDNYMLDAGIMKVYFGVKDKQLCISNDQAIFAGQSIKQENSLAKANYASIHKNTVSYGVLNIDALIKLPMIAKMITQRGEEGTIIRDVFSQWSYVEMVGNGDQSNQFTLYLKNKDENLLKQITTEIEKFIGVY